MSTTIYYNKRKQPFVVIGFSHRDPKNTFWKIKFLETGYETITTKGEMRRGNIRDYYTPSVAGVGYVGDCIKTWPRISQTREYRVWHNMINRCYNPNSTEWYHYGACGVTVCKRWHNLTNFIEDIQKLPGYDAQAFGDNLIHLDKDKKQFRSPSKEYSPETCEFVTPLENGRLIDRERRAIISIDPQGNVEHWGSVNDFIATHSRFKRSSVYKCLCKAVMSVYNWKFDYCNDYRKPNDGVSRVAASETLVGEVQSA